MLERTLVVVLNTYLVSGIVLIPVFIVASAMRMTIKRSLIPTMIGWGAVALTTAVYVVGLVS